MAIPILNSIDLKGQLRVDGGSAAYGQIEVGGNSGGIIDLKAPYSDDYDLRIHASSSAHEITTASGTLKLNTANTLAVTVESDQKVTFEKDIRTKEDLKVDGIIHLRNNYFTFFWVMFHNKSNDFYYLITHSPNLHVGICVNM